VTQPQNLAELQTDLRHGFNRNGVTLIELKHACVR
jgi:5-guanidino-2-oxopentanoate decarboxylase